MYDQWKLAGPEPCLVCDEHGYDSCEEHPWTDDNGPDPDSEWDSRFEEADFA